MAIKTKKGRVLHRDDKRAAQMVAAAKRIREKAYIKKTKYGYSIYIYDKR